MNFWTIILNLLKAAPAVTADVEALIAEIESILAQPSGSTTVRGRLDGLMAKLVTHVTTPGAAVVIEPIAKKV